MKSHAIPVAPGLDLPLDVVTQSIGLLAMRGAGKSNAAAVMAEGMFHANLPFAVIDPIGSWFGLRSSADGKGPGLSIPIFGGRHGDVPLERGSGELLADLIAEKRLSCVVDLSDFESEAAKKSFLLAFATRLYRRNTAPLHLFLEEADDYIPQRPMREETHLLRAFENIVRRGRARGLGITLITQRSASINKSVLTQIETLFVLRTTGPQDRKAIEEWVRYHDARAELLESLSGLKDGEAWCWSPHWLGKMVRVQINRRTTFDSGATPKEGTASARRGATLADVDLPKLSAEWTTSIERAKADDPNELRRRVAELEKQLAAKPSATPARVERVEVPVLTEADRKIIVELSDAAWKIGDLFGFKGPLGEIRERVARAALAPAAKQLKGAARRRHEPLPEAIQPPSVETLAQKASRAARSRTITEGVGGGERRMLAVLAEQGPSSRAKVGLLAGFSPTGGTFAKYLSNLRSAGLVVVNGAELEITDAGRAAAGDVEPMPSGRAAVSAWVERLGASRGAGILRVLSDAGGGPLSRAEVAARAGYEASGGTFAKYLSVVRTIGLVQGSGELRLAEALR